MLTFEEWKEKAYQNKKIIISLKLIDSFFLRGYMTKTQEKLYTNGLYIADDLTPEYVQSTMDKVHGRVRDKVAH